MRISVDPKNLYDLDREREREAMTPPPERTALNRVLLREAGEHLGTLAEQQHEECLIAPYRTTGWQKKYDRYAKLHKLSREVLEIANG
jgi:hypothetical protein